MFTTNNTPSSGNFYRKYVRLNSDSQKLFDSFEVKSWNSTPKNWRKFSIKLCSQEKHTAIPYYSSFKDRIDTLIQTPFINEIKKLNLMWCNFIYLFILIICLFVLIVLVICFSGLCCKSLLFPCKMFFGIYTQFSCIFYFLYQYVQTFHVASPHCLPRILLNIGSVYVTGFAKTWLQKSLSYTFTEFCDGVILLLSLLFINFLPNIFVMNR